MMSSSLRERWESKKSLFRCHVRCSVCPFLTSDRSFCFQKYTMNFDKTTGIIEMFMDSLEVTDEGTFTFNLVDGKAKGTTSLVLIGDGKTSGHFCLLNDVVHMDSSVYQTCRCCRSECTCPLRGSRRQPFLSCLCRAAADFVMSVWTQILLKGLWDLNFLCCCVEFRALQKKSEFERAEWVRKQGKRSSFSIT